MVETTPADDPLESLGPQGRVRRWYRLAERFQALADRPVYHMEDRAKPGHGIASRSTEHDDGYRLMAEMCRLMATTIEVL